VRMWKIGSYILNGIGELGTLADRFVFPLSFVPPELSHDPEREVWGFRHRASSEAGC
jgi:hypothetical protein